MAQIGAGQGSSYSNSIDSRQTWRNALASSPDSDTRLDSEAFNDFAAAIVAIETALGANPQGTFGSVAARLNQFLPGSGVSPTAVYFNNETEVIIPGTTHGLATTAILYQVYDNGHPAVAISPNAFGVQIDPASYDVTLKFTQQQSGFVVLSAGSPFYTTAFSGVTSLSIPGAAHHLNTADLLSSVYDDGNPSMVVRPNTFTVHPTTFDVVLTFVQPQAGILILSAAGPRAVIAFSNQTIVTIAGTTHHLATQALLFQVYDAATPASLIRPDSLSVHSGTYTVTMTFALPQSGRVVLVASQGSSGDDFEIRDAGIVNSTAVVMRSKAGNLELQMGAGQNILFVDQYGQALLDLIGNLRGSPSFYGLGIGITPAFQLHLATNSAAKPGSNTWTIASDERLKTAIEPFTEGLAQLLQCEPVSFEYNGLGGMPADGTRHIGFLAQALQVIAPYLVRSYRGQLTPESPETDLLTYEGHALSFMLVNALKELYGLYQGLQARCAALEAAVALLTPPAPEEEPAS